MKRGLQINLPHVSRYVFNDVYFFFPVRVLGYYGPFLAVSDPAYYQERLRTNVLTYVKIFYEISKIRFVIVCLLPGILLLRYE